MFRRISLTLILFFGFIESSLSQNSIDENFDNETTIILNDCPYLQLSGFKMKNNFVDPQEELQTELTWQNVSKTPILAFVVRFRTYDPFNNPIDEPNDWLVTGHDSADWSPLQPGDTGSDGINSNSTEPVLSSFVYVQKVRFADGGIWQANQHQIESEIQNQLPALHQFAGP